MVEDIDADCDENTEKLFTDDTCVAEDFNPIDCNDLEESSNHWKEVEGLSEACFVDLS